MNQQHLAVALTSDSIVYRDLHLHRECGASCKLNYWITFAHQAPILWNRLPSNLQYQQSLDAFKAQLKTYYFNFAFSSI
ncbi:MAG: hypothetical protein V2I33_21880 [Kangiellaceae bacterium]|nr:hypothetical protein [Kangiellaceae bacterium]